MGFATLVSSAGVSDDWELLNKYTKKSSITPVAPKRIIPPNLLEYYADVPPIEWMRDGISKETLQKYHIHFNIADNEAIIPHYDMDGNLIGIGRALLMKQKLRQDVNTCLLFYKGKTSDIL